MTGKQICLSRSVLDFIDAHIGPDSSVLEFGSGWSSAWLAQRCGRFLTFETKMSWVKNVAPELEPFRHAEIRLVPSTMMGFHNHVDQLLKKKRFQPDLVLVDCKGELRKQATDLGFKYLKRNGWLILDDAQRYDDIVEYWDLCAERPTTLEWQPGDIETARDRIAKAWQQPLNGFLQS